MGESITSGILAKWLVADGASVRQDQPLFSLETDKVTAEVNSPAAGVIRQKAAEGAEVAVGSVVALVEESAEVAAAAPAAAPASATADAKSAPQSGPAARRLAAEKGVDTAEIPGTGRDGRVTKGDIIAAAASPVAATPTTVNPQITDAVTAAAPQKAPAPAQAPAQAQKAVPVAPAAPATAPASARQTRRKMTPLRRRVAERLVRAKQEAAMLTTFNEVDMSAVMELRKVHQEAFQKRHGVKLGFMSFFVKAVVQALKEVPEVNTQLDGDEIVENHFYDIGIAVGAPRGLVVPVLRDADRKGFAQVEKDILAYGQKARDGKLSIDELTGGVFTITNGGIYGSLMSTPILNPPQSGILGMHAIKERAVVVDGQVVARPMMYIALSYDHRVIDGKEAVTFLVKVKEAIEDPIRLLFEV